MLVSNENNYYQEFEEDSEVVECRFCHKKYFRKELLREPGSGVIADDICPYCNGFNGWSVNSACGPDIKYINYKIEDMDK